MRHRTSRVRLAFAFAFVLAVVCMGLFVSAPPARANHDTISWSDPIHVAGAVGFSDTAVAVVADGRGFTYVFYLTTNTVASTTNVNVTKIQDVGPSGVPVVLFTDQVNDVPNVATSFIISAAADHEGNLYVAWVRTTAALGQEVYVSKSVDSGVTWLPAVRANAPNAAGSDFWPSMTVTPDGTIYVAWIQLWGGKSSFSISQSMDGGATFQSWTNMSSVYSPGSPSIASDAHGRVYVAYGAYLNHSSSTESVNVSWTDDGVTFAPWTTISVAGTNALFPALAVDQHGTVHLAWFTYYNGNYAISGSMSADRGATWTTPVFITTAQISGYIGYLATEGDTLMYVSGPLSPGLGYIVSGNDGASWYPAASLGNGYSYTEVAADQNGTFWAAYVDGAGISLRYWVGPPSAPVVSAVVASGSTGLTVSWTPAPEQNVAYYQVWRSGDGSTYQIVATLSASAASFADTGLANGTYWYKVTAVNVWGTPSHDSNAVSGVVGVTIAQLQNEIAALQGQLNLANANLGSIQTQLNAIKGQVATLQGNTSALQNQINNLQNQLNTMQNQQATQTISYANLAFEIIVVALLVVLLFFQMRKPKSPQLMMAQPGQAQASAPPKQPEDDL